MKPNHLRRAIGGTSVFLGLGGVWKVIGPVLRSLWTGKSNAGDYPLYLTIIPLLTIPGILAVVFGIRLLRTMNISSLKWIVGLLAVFGALAISAALAAVFPHLLPKEVASSAFLLVGSLLVIPAYSAVLRLILPYLGHDRDKPVSLIGRGALILIAWQFWMLLRSIFEAYSPIEEGYRYVPKEPWGIIGVIVPIIVAYGAYRLAVRLIPTTKGAPGAVGHQRAIGA